MTLYLSSPFSRDLPLLAAGGLEPSTVAGRSDWRVLYHCGTTQYFTNLGKILDMASHIPIYCLLISQIDDWAD
jgi:hypothetical protein